MTEKSAIEIVREQRAALESGFTYRDGCEVALARLHAAVEREALDRDDIRACKDGTYYCTWAEDIVRRADAAEARAEQWKTSHGLVVTEIIEVERARDVLASELNAVTARAERLAAEVEALRKDAARYRWLRENCRAYWSGQDAVMEPVQLIHYEPNLTGPIEGWRERLDDAIDAALAQEEGKP